MSPSRTYSSAVLIDPCRRYNNTYGIQLIAEDVYKAGLQDWTRPKGCRDQIIACRDLGDQYDPDVTAANDTVNAACVAAFQCSENVIGGFDALTNRSDFDIAHLKPDPTNPFSNLLGFFNQPWVQTELGVPLNFSGEYNALEGIILGTGDVSRVPGLSMIEYLLDSGVKVALVYGDRDYRCPWNGGESLSLKANCESRMRSRRRLESRDALLISNHHHRDWSRRLP